MSSFLGTYTPRLDEKGRIILPAKYREAFSDGLVLTRGQERCVYVWPTGAFAAFTANIDQAPITNRTVRNFTRMLYAGASDEVPDRQGRVTVPPMLRAYAGLRRDCVVIGAGDRVEIWDADAWSTYTSAQESAFADWSEEVVPSLP